MSFLTKPLGLAVIAVVVYILTLGALFTQSKDVFAAVLKPKGPVLTAEAIEQQEANFIYWSFRTNEINKLIRDLKAERASLDQRQEEVAAAEARVEGERKEMERLRQDVENYRKELSAYLVEIAAGEQANLRTEVAILNNMAPENIVALFKEKDDEDVVRLMSMMKPDAIAPVLEQMMAQPQTDEDEPPARRAARLLEMLKRTKKAPNP